MIGFGNFQNSLCWGPLSMAMGLVASGHLEGDACQSPFTLKQLFKKSQPLRTFGDMKLPVRCLISDSKRVIPGSVFFAIEGNASNGNHFIEEAIDRGAVAIVSSKKAPRICPVTYIQVEDVRQTLAEVSKIFYKSPDEALRLVGITGTNGKTTTSMILQALLKDDTAPVGLIGTVRYDLGNRSLPSYRTTPESLDAYAMLDQMRQNRCQAAVMEVSSHGIEQKRVHGMHFEVAAFLNLTQDHIDFHGSMEAYFAAKSALLQGKTGALPKVAVVNLDDAYAEPLMASLPSKAKVVTFSTHNPEATLFAKDLQLGATFSHFELVCPQGTFPVHLPLPGMFNVSNALAALAIFYGMGHKVPQALPRLEAFKGISGRMQQVEAPHPANCFVDYAHTEDALRKAIEMLRSVTPGRVYVVFGCGGDRDRTKRPKMVQAVLEHAHHAWATSDNPRSEPLSQIFSDMKEGLGADAPITFIDDRREAIAAALKVAQAGDALLVAGKGHEAYQEFADSIIPFDDARVIQECVEEMGLA
jgi:UDP-N-acetylmuramoyl-L-alanyl-D-glutamate--2,6-diaminopimelate ligase